MATQLIWVKDPETGELTKQIVEYIPEPEPTDAEKAAAIQLAPSQFHAMIAIAGLTEAVEAAIEAIADPQQKAVAQAKYKWARFYVRTDPFVNMLAPAVGITSEQLDTMWLQAAEIN